MRRRFMQKTAILGFAGLVYGVLSGTCPSVTSPTVCVVWSSCNQSVPPATEGEDCGFTHCFGGWGYASSPGLETTIKTVWGDIECTVREGTYDANGNCIPNPAGVVIRTITVSGITGVQTAPCPTGGGGGVE